MATQMTMMVTCWGSSCTYPCSWKEETLRGIGKLARPACDHVDDDDHGYDDLNDNEHNDDDHGDYDHGNYDYGGDGHDDDHDDYGDHDHIQ